MTGCTCTIHPSPSYRFSWQESELPLWMSSRSWYDTYMIYNVLVSLNSHYSLLLRRHYSTCRSEVVITSTAYHLVILSHHYFLINAAVTRRWTQAKNSVC